MDITAKPFNTIYLEIEFSHDISMAVLFEESEIIFEFLDTLSDTISQIGLVLVWVI